MTDHELRRAISRGPFTELLDELAGDEIVKRAFGDTALGDDVVQQLLLRYFAIRRHGVENFGRPSIGQQGLETMKSINSEMQSWAAAESDAKRKDMTRRLLTSLQLVVNVFEPNEPFRRAVPILKKDVLVEQKKLKKVWVNSNKISSPIWDVVMCALSGSTLSKRHQELTENRDTVRASLIDLMQTNPSFTDSLTLTGTPRRVRLFEEALSRILDLNGRDRNQVSTQTRRELINRARRDNCPCPLCDEPLGGFDEHLHIDHKIPRAKGGDSNLANLQVVHKSCNLKKSDKLLPDGGLAS